MQIVLAARADLDVPGETGRTARILAIWSACLLLAVVVSAERRPIVPERLRHSDEPQRIMERFWVERAMLAFALGVLLPSLLTMALSHRHRRGGGHARGIVVDVTADGQLRIWGRGYGMRLVLAGANVSETLVDVYSGRLGAWRQRRMTVVAKRALPNSPAVVELATVAIESDDALGLPLRGREGDCIELLRADYLALRTKIEDAAQRRAETLIDK